ncbi:MAG: hypothetical protein ACL93V_02530 [Candidatus Electrothrix sp. YB6]
MKKLRLSFVFVLFALSLGLLASCGSLTNTVLQQTEKAFRQAEEAEARKTLERPENLKKVDTEPVEVKGLFKDPTRAIAALKKKVGGDKVMAIKLLIYPTFITLEIQDQNKKENVDAYEYKNGLASGPVPVKLIGNSDQNTIDANTFNLDECDFTKVPFMVRDIQERFQLENEEVTLVSLERNLPFSDEVQFRVYVDGTRKDGSITYDKKGNIMKVWR